MTPTQSIRVDKVGARYVARVSFEQREIPKAAGFRWDPNAKAWWTDKPEIAAKLGSPEAVAQAIREKAEADTRKAHAIETSKAQDYAGEIPCPEGLSYLPYQRAGIAYAMARSAVLIGDEMGLGKTIQAIGVLNCDDSLKRVLLVCPASLRLNWQRELRKWLVRPMRSEIATSGWLPTSNVDVTIINYDILGKHSAAIRKQEWDCIIIDEAHYLKNPKAKRTIALLGMNRRGEEPIPPVMARRRIMLTGTPIPNRPIEGQPIFHYLSPETKRFSFWNYAQRYCNASQSRFGWDVSGSSNLPELQDLLRATIMVRRRKADVLQELPAKRRVLIEVEAEGAQGQIAREVEAFDRVENTLSRLRVQVELAKAEGETAYKNAVEALRDATQAAFTEMSKLRHETAVAKVPQVIEHLKTALETEGHKIVVFAHHKDVVKGIMEALAADEVKAVQVTGDTGMMERQKNVDTFQQDPETRVFVGNIQAAGVGLTLTAAAHVIFAELDWVPGNITQAEDRCHRIGQRDSVLVEHLVLDGSLDARMARTLIDKQTIIDAALDDERPALAAEPATPTRDRAATEDLSRAKIEAQAGKVTDEIARELHRGLGILAGLDGDHAREQNGIGFSKMDVEIGHSLARQGMLSKRQAVLAARLCNKYRRQLPEEIVAMAKEVLNA